MGTMDRETGRGTPRLRGVSHTGTVLRGLGVGLAVLALVVTTTIGGLLMPLVRSQSASTSATITRTATGYEVTTSLAPRSDILSALVPAALAEDVDHPTTTLAGALTLDGHPSTGDFVFVDAAGADSQFHVSTQGVDFSRPWGVLFWFEGDGTAASASTIPDSQRLSDLATMAAAHDMVLVVPDTPDSADPTDVTWWEDYDGNGAWFRALETVLVGTWDADTTRVWFAGYSGGADFISTELLPSGNDWIGGGGAVMIGGGESPDTGVDHTEAMTSMPLTWYVGTDDGEIDSDDWSPLRVATQGEAAWRKAGFTDTSLVILPGLGHTDYDPAELVGRALDAAGVTD